jgi:tRNA threonylcarbamoyladenosine biosynthesis protein TsaB
MLILAVDTSGKNGSLALVRGSESRFEVLELIPLAGRMYSAQLIPELQNALARQNLKKSDIDAYAVASGPGSFTGLRVGLSTVKALSEVQGKPIAAVSVLEAAARMTARNGNVIVAVDAGRQQVFVGEYVFSEDHKVISANESLVAYADFFRSVRDLQVNVFSPDAAVREAATGHEVTIHEVTAPQADMFARIGYQKIVAGETTPTELLEANYLRASDAELFSLPKLMS